MDLSTQASGIGALADDTRRALYEYVRAQSEPVGREQAAHALGIAQHSVSFHLDRLVAEGLLTVEYRRLNGRSGPGAGRPSKLYRRSEQEFAVSLPERRYDIVGEILAAAVTRAQAGEPIQESLAVAARECGVALGSQVEKADRTPSLEQLAALLSEQGFEARVEGHMVELINCPFHDLAQKHTALVCGLNRDFVEGMVDGLGVTGISACLEPEPGRCCVKARELS